MTVPQSPSAPRGPVVQPADVRALGEGLLARSDDCWKMCELRLEALGIEEVGTPEFRVRRRAAQLLGVQLFGRWLLTGETSTLEERTWLGELGRQGAQTDVSIAHMTRGYLIFRDVVAELLDDEAKRLGTSAEVLGRVHRMNALSCDSSVLWMTRYFDQQKELQAAEAVRLNAELVASEARFRSVYESLACGVMVFSPDGIVTSCNDAAVAMFGIPAEKVIGTSVFEVGPTYRAESGTVLNRVPSAEAVATRVAVHGVVVKHDFGDGRPVHWFQVDAVPIFDGDGKLVEVVSSSVDVTAVKAAEELRAESAAKSRFLATMSHELRTPLNSILGFAQLLRIYDTGRLDETQKRYVKNIETSGGHLLALISDILELSKVAAGQVVLELQDVDVAPAIQQVADEFEPMLTAKPITLRLDLRPRLAARVDPLRFRQVVVNLLANALKFTEAGSVTISTRRRARQLELRVADTGIGIPPDQIDRVFDEFTQVDNSPTRTHGGTGLGLPLTRRLVELMGGTVVLESAVGQGTTAVVLLPLG
ncbi:MAG TPA: ATP-binding protein [Candidatus Dormibacteraeota bacterium]|jgi:PAS domain S-box-containing protein